MVAHSKYTGYTVYCTITDRVMIQDASSMVRACFFDPIGVIRIQRVNNNLIVFGFAAAVSMASPALQHLKAISKLWQLCFAIHAEQLKQTLHWLTSRCGTVRKGT